MPKSSAKIVPKSSSSKGKVNLKASVKVQKGGNYEITGGFNDSSLSTNDNSTIIIIILVFIIALGCMFIYFKFYDQPPVQQVIIQQTPSINTENKHSEQGMSEKMINIGDPEDIVVYPTQKQYIVNKELERLTNPLLPPERSYVLNNFGVPAVQMPGIVQIPTRGFVGGYQQLGLLYKKDPSGDTNNDGNILPLFGKPTYTNSNRWNYYTSSDKFHSLKMPIKVKGKNSMDENGVNELYDGDSVIVGPYNGEFTVEIYGYDSPKYLPQIL